MANILIFLQRLPRELLDLLLPSPPEVRVLERMSARQFALRAHPATSAVHGVISLFDYKDPLVKTLVWQIKFKGRKDFIKIIAELMHEHLLAELAELELFEGFEKPLLIPVPLSDSRLRERGFNQTLLVAEEMERIDQKQNMEICDAIKKIKDTPSQVETHNRNERTKNIAGSFAIKNPSDVRGRDIIVLDDVVTTGSTIAEMKKVLTEAGARRIVGFTFAH